MDQWLPESAGMGCFGSSNNVLKLDSGAGCTTLCIHEKPLNCVHCRGEFYVLGTVFQ